MPSAADIIKDSVSEFSRLQKWMISVKDKDSSLGVNLSELDRIKE